MCAVRNNFGLFLCVCVLVCLNNKCRSEYMCVFFDAKLDVLGCNVLLI